MRKKLFLSIGAVAIIAVAVFNMSLSNNSEKYDDLFIQNVEALSNPDDVFDPGVNQSQAMTTGRGKCNTWVSSSDGSYYKPCTGTPTECISGSNYCSPDCWPDSGCW